MRKSKDADWFQDTDTEGNLGIDYENMGGEAHKYFVKVKSRRFVEIVRNHFGGSKKLSCIDIGCGTGETCYWLSKCFKSVDGVDYAAGMIALAKKKKIINCRFHVADSSGLDFKDGEFDVAVFFNVIHHIESRKILMGAIAEAKRVVRKGGLVVVVDLNPYNPVTRHVVNTNEIDSAVSLGGFKKGNFPTTLTPGECVSLLEKNGLNTKYKEFLIFFPRHFSFLLPLEKIFRKVPIGGLYLVAGVKV